MLFGLASRYMREIDSKCLFSFMYNFAYKGMRSVSHFKKRQKQGEYYPAFLFISVTNKCSLSCTGCWVSRTDKPVELEIDNLHRVIEESKKKGVYFYGILGGEPMLYSQLFSIFEKHRDCYFLLFTNGLHIDGPAAARMRSLTNVSPLVSIEGDREVSDIRRDGKDVYRRSMDGLDECIKAKLVTGVATSVCKNNLDTLATESFVDELIKKGVHYIWYYIYRPVGPSPGTELCLSNDEVVRLREFLVTIRKKKPVFIIDAYWDHEGKSICPAASGIGLHINPAGFVEPCPPVQLATDSIYSGVETGKLIGNSDFLRDFRKVVPPITDGCILMEDPAALARLAKSWGCQDSSLRGTMYKELLSSPCFPSHRMGGKRIPEKHWFYKFAKKNSFFGLGAYG